MSQTLTQLQAAVADTEGQIQKKKERIEFLKGRAATISATAQTQIAWAKTKNCKKDNKCKMDVANAIADSNKKLTDAAAFLSEAKTIENIEIPALQVTLGNQNAAIDDFNQSELEVSQALANQGQTRDSVYVKSQMEGQADYDAKMLAAQTEASAKKNFNYVIIGAAVLVIAIIAFIAYKKLKK